MASGLSHKSLLFVMILGFALAVQPAGAQTDCIAGSGGSSRACLITIAEQYCAALAAHDPSKAPMARNVRFTQKPDKRTSSSPVGGNIATTNLNNATLAVGEGLWKTMTEGPTTFKIYVPDPVSQEIGGIAMIKSENQPTAFAFRLKVDNGRITDADHILVPITNAAALENLKAPRPELVFAVPPTDRLDRETLRSLAYTYYDAKSQSAHALPLADNCVRRENGAPTASCGSGLSTTEISYIDGLSVNRFRIADPETGLVFSLTYNFLGGVSFYSGGFPFASAHINKVQGNKILAIEAMGIGQLQVQLSRTPAQAPRDWSAFTR